MKKGPHVFSVVGGIAGSGGGDGPKPSNSPLIPEEQLNKFIEEIKLLNPSHIVAILEIEKELCITSCPKGFLTELGAIEWAYSIMHEKDTE